MPRLVELGGMAGTPARVATPAPVPVLIPDRVPKVSGLVPFIAEGEKVRKLQFTGRGLLFDFPSLSIPVSTTAVLRRKSVRVPFRGLVSLMRFYTGSNSTAGLVFPVGSFNALDTTLVAEDSGGDFPLMELADQPSFGGRGLASVVSGSWDVVPLDYLLPEGRVYLGVHYFNAGSAARTMTVQLFVREVISAI